MSIGTLFGRSLRPPSQKNRERKKKGKGGAGSMWDPLYPFYSEFIGKGKGRRGEG